MSARSTRCVGAAIYDEHAEPLGAISIAGPSSRLADERIRKLGPIVAHVAEELTRQVGGRWRVRGSIARAIFTSRTGPNRSTVWPRIQRSSHMAIDAATRDSLEICRSAGST